MVVSKHSDGDAMALSPKEEVPGDAAKLPPNTGDG